MDAPLILVVEDDIAIQGFCQTVLESAGFRVDAVATAADAVVSFKKSAPDLIILDYSLPDGNGVDLAKQMGLDSSRKTPFLFLTARQDLSTRLECFQLGAHDYIQKPFAVEELLARVKVHLKVKASYDDMAKRNYELELRERARQDLTDMLVHDLKAPLTSIQGTLELIAARGLISGDAYKSLLGHAGTAAEFMLLMLNDILDVGQASTVGLKVERMDVDVAQLFEKLNALFAGRMQKLGVPIAHEIDPAAKNVLTDRNLVFRVLANLIQNALKASDKGSKVELLAARRDGFARFTVADRGPGVPEADKERIFEKYTTSSKRANLTDAGSGVGLTFCRMAAKALEGRVWVEDRPGGGSLFNLEVKCPAS